MMQFTIVCPVDGEQTVGLQNIESMVVHKEGRADITFRCPQCGTRVQIVAPVPAFLMSTMESISQDLGIPVEDGKVEIKTFFANVDRMMSEQDAGADEITLWGPRRLTREEEADLGFFRYELANIDSVSQLLAEPGN